MTRLIQKFLYWFLKALEPDSVVAKSEKTPIKLIQERLAFLENELLKIRENEALITKMLSPSQDSFHHALAASTEHLQSSTQRRLALESEHKALREKLRSMQDSEAA